MWGVCDNHPDCLGSNMWHAASYPCYKLPVYLEYTGALFLRVASNKNYSGLFIMIMASLNVNNRH